MKKIFLSLLTIGLLFAPGLSLAATLEAEVVKVIKEENNQQNLQLHGLTGEFEGQNIYYYGISEIEVTHTQLYKTGDKVIVDHSTGPDGQDAFYIVDYVRRTHLYLLVGLFALTILIIGRLKGLRSLLSLTVSFCVIIFFIVPLILNGYNPLLIGVIGCFFILLAIIYLTEGFNKKSHFSVLSITVALALTFLLSYLFTTITRLTGLAEDEVTYLIGLGKNTINFQTLLLTGIMIGALGVLDDIVISQVETIAQLKKANPNLSKTKIFKMAYEVGNTHIGAVVNTLFLAYAGAALPLILLYAVQADSLSLSMIINNEIIATEIVRTLVGSIGLALAMPLTTFITAWFYKR